MPSHASTSILGTGYFAEVLAYYLGAEWREGLGSWFAWLIRLAAAGFTRAPKIYIAGRPIPGTDPKPDLLERILDSKTEGSWFR